MPDAELVARTAEAYQQMEVAGVHPRCGSANLYGTRFVEEEDTQRFVIGCPDILDREAFVFAIEAARAIAGVDLDRAVALLRMAAESLELSRYVYSVADDDSVVGRSDHSTER